MKRVDTGVLLLDFRLVFIVQFDVLWRRFVRFLPGFLLLGKLLLQKLLFFYDPHPAQDFADVLVVFDDVLFRCC
jgi:hypothetical protein